MLKIKKFASVLLAILIITALFSTFSIGVSAASNHKDMVFDFELPNKGYYKIDVYQGAAKLNATSSYVYYLSGPQSNTLFSIHGTNRFGLFGGNKMSDYRNCTKGDSAEVRLGNKRLIKQYVYEWGYKYCSLGGCNNYYPNRTIKGNWSADSVGSYPHAN